MQDPELLNATDVLDARMTPAAEVEKEVEASAFTPIPDDEHLLVVNGMWAKGFRLADLEVKLWKRSLHDRVVDLVPVYKHGKKAYEVQINGNLRGYRSEEHTSELQSLRHLVCR